jgi:hypothetical protein
MLLRTLPLLSVPLVIAACSGSTHSSDDGSEDALRRNDKIATDADLAHVREEIDNVCGDSWCEGDYDWGFKRLTCSRSTASCQFEFEAIYTIWAYGGDGLDDQEIGKLRYPHTCEIKGIHERKDIVDDSGGSVTYADSFYDKVDECIAKHEETIRPLVKRDEISKYASRCEANANASATVTETTEVWDKSAVETQTKAAGGDVFPGPAADLTWTVTDKVETSSQDPICARWAKQLPDYSDMLSVRGVSRDNRVGEIIVIRERPSEPHERVLETRLSLKRF